MAELADAKAWLAQSGTLRRGMTPASHADDVGGRRPGQRRRRGRLDGGQPAPGRAAGDGDVRARRRHVADERVDRAVVEDLDTTVSGVQGAIALEALVSAAFILIGSKVGDLIGRKRAFVLGLLGYALGALAMAFAQGLTAIIVFWAIIGGLGASLLLPAMQSLIHGNFEARPQKKAYALVGAAAAIAAAVGPLLGGFLTTFLSWRVGFLLEVVVIVVVLSGLKLVHDVPYTGPRASTSSARCCRRSAWAAS